MKNLATKNTFLLLTGLFCCSLWTSAQEYPMGYRDESTLSCYREFMPVEFQAKYKWVTNGDLNDPATGLKMPYTTYQNMPFDGQTTPLVGDLNNDGKPEIVCLSLDDNTLNAITATNEFLYILNGQNGRIILKYRLPARTYSKGLAYHGTPCQIVLADADRNGKSEIIIALGGYYGYSQTNLNFHKWSKRLLCYEVNDKTFSHEFLPTEDPNTLPAYGIVNGAFPTPEGSVPPVAANADCLTLKWVSDKRYDWNSYENESGSSMAGTVAVPSYTFSDVEAGGAGKGFTDGGGFCYANNGTTGGGVNSLYYYCTPMPQTIEIDNKGNIGILVYNKIYDAITGKMLMELEHLGHAYITDVQYQASAYGRQLTNGAFTGRDVSARNDGGGNGGDTNVGFTSVYDADSDGKMDIAAGGKVYFDMDFGDPNTLGDESFKQLQDVPGNGLYSTTASADFVGDGHTATADINDDGIEEVVVLHRRPGDIGASGTILLTAYNPGFWIIDGGIKTKAPLDVNGLPTPIVVAQVAVPVSGLIYGNHSIAVIGDLDNLQQNGGHKYPEISFISGDLYSGINDNVPLHPNVATALRSKLVAGTGVNAGKYYTDSAPDGYMMSFTYDNTETDVTKRFKVSFILEHSDNSNNTTFSLFDFDNNGTQDICYRDLNSLRIISPQAPYYVDINDKPEDNPMIKFSTPVWSATAFEGPAIADVDGDGSADMIVMGNTALTYWTNMYAVEAFNTQFAPCPSVWNQFKYNGLRIMEDLTIPTNRFDPLDPKFNYILDKTKPNDRTWIYNNTMTQVPIHALFPALNPDIVPGDLTGTAADSIIYMAPILLEPDVKVWAETITTGTPRFRIHIANGGSAALNSSYPVVIYAIEPNNINSISKMTRADVFPVGEPVYPGDTLVIERQVAMTNTGLSTLNANNDYIVRISDANYSYLTTGTYSTTTGHPNYQRDGKMWQDNTYLECNWTDNWAYTSAFKVANDIFTLQPYDKIVFNVMDNDEAPATCSGVLPAFALSDFVVDSQGLGTRITNGSEVTYTAPPTYSNGVIDMTYSLTCSGITKSAHIYIYLLENLTGEYAACLNTNITVGAKEQPTGTTFKWRDSYYKSVIEDTPGTFLLTGDTTFYVTPFVPAPYDMIAFPEDTVPVRAIGAGDGKQELLTWKGTAGDGSWNNPNNWVFTSSGLPTGYSPNVCTDVILPSNTGNGYYPKAEKAGSVGKITMQDHSMIANTHLIDYDSASMEINFGLVQRNRWVAYSAPFRKTYTGDFMLRNAAEIPLNGLPVSGVTDPAVYMSFFQTAYPDEPSITATARAFTQPFSKLDIPLPLGKSFNVWIDTDVDTSTPFRFPSPLNQYEYWVHYPYGAPSSDREFSDVLIRTDGTSNATGKRINGRFIVEDAASTDPVTGEFTLMPPDDAIGYSYVMVPNPFIAYMQTSLFFYANEDQLQSRYVLWNGADGGFASYQELPAYRPDAPSLGGTWWISSSPTGWINLVGGGYIPPLQSFFVEKKDPNSVLSLTYNPTVMTNTTAYNTPYLLRDAPAEPAFPEGLLYVTAAQGEVSNSTVIVNMPESSNDYTKDEDATKLMFDNEDGMPQLSVYTLTPQRKALDINLSSDFDDVEIPVGIRTNITGEITLDFPGLEGFGHKVYLRDGNTKIDLGANPSYKTTIAGNGGDPNRFYEINDRFALVFPTAATGIESESSDVRVQTGHGKILIDSDDAMESVEVLSVSGANVYRSSNAGNFVTVDVAPQQVYIVRIATSKGVTAQKVIVK